MRSPREYLAASLQRLSEWLQDHACRIENYTSGEDYAWTVEEDSHGYAYCLCSYPEIPGLLDETVLLVYDEQMNIIADLSGLHCSAEALLKQPEVYDEISLESDWMYLEYYIVTETFFPERAWLLHNEAVPEDAPETGGQVFLFRNAYVTAVLRRQGIFRTMLEILRDHIMRAAAGQEECTMVLSLDPDIACYGPDAKDEPYYYSYEKDEPDRIRNRIIAEHTGFSPVRLELTEQPAEDDGTKVWFAVRHERDIIVETEVQ